LVPIAALYTILHDDHGGAGACVLHPSPPLPFKATPTHPPWHGVSIALPSSRPMWVRPEALCVRVHCTALGLQSGCFQQHKIASGRVATLSSNTATSAVIGTVHRLLSMS